MDLQNFDIKYYKPELQDREPNDEADVSMYDLCQPKYDGWFVVLHVKDHVATVITSGGEIRSHFPLLSPDAVLLGEWIYGTNWAQSSPDLGKYILFDMLEFSTDNMSYLPYHERIERLRLYVKGSEPIFRVIETFQARDWEVIWRHYVDERNFEGLVFKNSAFPFEIQKQARMKKVVTWNYVVVGFKEGTKRLEGTLGALVAGLMVDGKVIRIMDVGGGFSDVLRREIWDNKDQYLGMCFEARGKQRFDTGALRHPAFTKFRPDVSSTECTK